MKKSLCAFIALVLILCGASASAEERSFDGKVLATIEMEASADEIEYFFQNQLGIPIADFVCFPTVTECLMALKMGKVDTLLNMDASAKYIAEQDDSLYVYMDPRLADYTDISLSMVTLKTNSELGARLDEAISALREDGTLDKLVGSLFSEKAYEVAAETDAAAETIYVGVTGEMPPVDYVDASGAPVGFNVNLMNAVGNKLGAKIEFIQMNKAAFTTALASGKIDVAFWQEQSVSEEMLKQLGPLSDLIYITEPYLTLSISAIELK